MAILALDAAVLERFGRDWVPAIRDSLRFFWPEILVASAAMAIILVDAFLPRRLSRHMVWPALAACIVPALLVFPLLGEASRPLFLGMASLDPLANFFKVFLLLGTVPVILLSHLSAGLKDLRMGEYYGILLTAVLGGMLMASASHLVMAFLALELLSISSYILVGYLKTDRRGAEAALKYIIYGSVAAGIMAYGFSLLYGLAGSADFRDLGRLLDGVRAGSGTVGAVWPAAILAILFSFAGMAFKIASVPMHFWCPDVYEGAPTAVTAFLSVGSKAAGFALALRFLHALKILDADLARSVNWPIIILVLSVFTMTLGNFAALWQDNLKRMLAYSSIAHAGYMMMGLAVVQGTLPGVGVPGMGLVAYYLMAYLAMNLGAFAVVILVEERLGSVDIGSYAGLGRRAPFLAAALTVFFFSLIGIPPTAGFTGKLQLFSGVLAEAQALGWAGGWPYYALALAAVVNTAVSVYYYARVIRNMYLLSPSDPLGGGAGGPIRVPFLGTAVVALLLFLTFYLFFRLESVTKVTRSLTIFS